LAEYQRPLANAWKNGSAIFLLAMFTMARSVRRTMMSQVLRLSTE
jgi:hypothetical protein